MSELHLCIPVLKRYDLLRELIRSLHASTVKPTCIHVIDNGQAPRRLEWACRDAKSALDLFTPEKPMGVAESWNWFILNTPEERVISNDDLTFASHSLERIIATPGVLVTGLRGHAFSCFVIRDECVQKVGLFDDTLSPGYAYFEDCDYEERMRAAGVMFEHCDGADVVHLKSSTLAVLSPYEKGEHVRKFLIAQDNYLAKWGKMPEGMEKQVVKEVLA